MMWEIIHFVVSDNFTLTGSCFRDSNTPSALLNNSRLPTRSTFSHTTPSITHVLKGVWYQQAESELWENQVNGQTFKWYHDDIRDIFIMIFNLKLIL